jgi:hypothetical protein
VRERRRRRRRRREREKATCGGFVFLSLEDSYLAKGSLTS